MDRTMSTEELASKLRVKPNTIRRGFCVDGHYLTLRPIKLSNGRLLWSADQANKLLEKLEDAA